MKKVISTIIAVLMLITVFAAIPAFAAEDVSVWDGTVPTDSGKTFEGRGTEKNPYLIQSAEELAYFAMLVRKNSADTCYKGKYFKLTTDIDLNNKPWYPIGGFTENAWMADEQQYFAGHFDGDGHVIKNFVPATKDSSNKVMNKCGLFGWIAGATISNLGLESSQAITYEGNSRSAGLVGVARYGFKISNCYYKGDMILKSGAQGDMDIGGILGWSGDTADANTTDKYEGVYNSSRSIESCYYVGNVSITYNGNVDNGGVVRFGGMAARFHNNGATITNCYSQCDVDINFVTDRSTIDGAKVLIGLIAGDMSGDTSGTYEGLYSSGKITYTGNAPKHSSMGLVIGICVTQPQSFTGQDIEYVIGDGSQITTPYSSRLFHECPTWLNVPEASEFSLPVMDGTSFLEEVSAEEEGDGGNTNGGNTDDGKTDDGKNNDTKTDGSSDGGDASGDDTTSEAEEERGCGSLVGGGIALMAVASVGTCVLARKKKND